VARMESPVFDRLRYGRQPQSEAVLFAFDLLESAGRDMRAHRWRNANEGWRS
jgi:hypothetical protein